MVFLQYELTQRQRKRIQREIGGYSDRRSGILGELNRIYGPDLQWSRKCSLVAAHNLLEIY